MLRKLLAVFAFLGVASQAQATYVWEIQDNYVDQVAIYFEVVSGTGYHVMAVTLKNPISTGCALADSTRTINVWVASDTSRVMSLWYSTLLSAQAQGLKVDIRTDNSICNGAFGRWMQGVRLKSN